MPLANPLPEGEYTDETSVDLRDVIGQRQGKRALEIIAAGGHNLLMIGPPGTGKTMLASRLPGLLPPLSNQEALESAAVPSFGRFGHVMKNWRRRPFRAPHHSASLAAMVGGGSIPAPGEISLAHNGVLFWMSCLNSNAGCWMRYANPLSQGLSISHARAPKSIIQPVSSLLQR